MFVLVFIRTYTRENIRGQRNKQIKLECESTKPEHSLGQKHALLLQSRKWFTIIKIRLIKTLSLALPQSL